MPQMRLSKSSGTKLHFERTISTSWHTKSIQSDSKKLIRQRMNPNLKCIKNAQPNMPDTCNEDNCNESLEVCAVLSLEGENLFYVRLKFNSDIKRRALIDTGSCANALPRFFF